MKLLFVLSFMFFNLMNNDFNFFLSRTFATFIAVVVVFAGLGSFHIHFGLDEQ